MITTNEINIENAPIFNSSSLAEDADDRGAICWKLDAMIKAMQIDCSAGASMQKIESDEGAIFAEIANYPNDIPKGFAAAFSTFSDQLNQEYVPGQGFPANLWGTFFQITASCEAVGVLCDTKTDLQKTPLDRNKLQIDLEALNSFSNFPELFSYIQPIATDVNGIIHSLNPNTNACIQAINQALNNL